MLMYGFDRFLELNMIKNVGSIDRTLRIIAGLTLIGLAATGIIGAWGWVGIVPILTGSTGSCPAYSVMGLSTCKLKDKP